VRSRWIAPAEGGYSAPDGRASDADGADYPTPPKYPASATPAATPHAEDSSVTEESTQRDASKVQPDQTSSLTEMYRDLLKGHETGHSLIADSLLDTSGALRPILFKTTGRSRPGPPVAPNTRRDIIWAVSYDIRWPDSSDSGGDTPDNAERDRPDPSSIRRWAADNCLEIETRSHREEQEA
jgi:hypothetical protein